jgi:hypothetical protein
MGRSAVAEVSAPIVIGYQSAWLTTPQRVATGCQRLAQFTAWQGWRLDHVIVDADPHADADAEGAGGVSRSAYRRAIQAAHEPGIAGIVVPSLEDLAPDALDACAVRERMAREARAPVVLADTSEPADPRHRTRIEFEVPAASGRAVPVLVTLHRTWAEVSLSGQGVAALDRDRLRGWLAIPAGPLAAHGMTLEPAADDRITLTVTAASDLASLEAGARASVGPLPIVVDRQPVPYRTLLILRAWV